MFESSEEKDWYESRRSSNSLWLVKSKTNDHHEGVGEETNEVENSDSLDPLHGTVFHLWVGRYHEIHILAYTKPIFEKYGNAPYGSQE